MLETADAEAEGVGAVPGPTHAVAGRCPGTTHYCFGSRSVCPSWCAVLHKAQVPVRELLPPVCAAVIESVFHSVLQYC